MTENQPKTIPRLIYKNILAYRTYKKLYCKGEPYGFSGQRDPSLHTQKSLLLYIIRITIYENNKRIKISLKSKISLSLFFQILIGWIKLVVTNCSDYNNLWFIDLSLLININLRNKITGRNVQTQPVLKPTNQNSNKSSQSIRANELYTVL